MFGLSKRTLILLGAALLVALLFSVRSQDSGANASQSGECSFTVDADVLNVRESPRLGAPVVDSFTDGEDTDALATVRNGFRKIEQGRWSADRYLRPAEENTCR